VIVHVLCSKCGGDVYFEILQGDPVTVHEMYQNGDFDPPCTACLSPVN
jgi:hypothetical protein